ncbi:hypothetical protein M0657_002821 [Pyricularia oryzae]|uniref:Acetate kinase n=1 Tax=Pyricularia oryzae TaxID=318829 RepID=A0A4P7NNR9_PYROR|nr:hypothetical protein M9X92_008394 [Pyricularia oryzae]KAI7928138.1 hypothetical protein M0657_002821 [Pyricularia oryzae]QBZ63840.1 hypothetical protein PoMZ_05531 [Pyricularia oryzae]
MASSSSGSSSFSSNVRYPPSYRQAQTSPLDPIWTPATTSTASAPTSYSSEAPTPLRPLDLGPPGYQATITLFQQTADEMTVYLGPWEIESAGPDHRRLSWQCSYEGEVLEHYLPSSNPSDTFPLSLHAHHRRFESPHDMELYLSFNSPQRIRYTAADGTIMHDAVVEVNYVLATFEGSLRFQSDLREREVVDFFDMDVVWSDREGRTDSFGSVKGIATGLRMKLWKDRYSSQHTIALLGRDGRPREYWIAAFDGEVKSRDDRHRRLKLNVIPRRGSAHEPTSGPSSRRPSFSSFRSRTRSMDDSNAAGNSQASSTHDHVQRPNFRYLGMQFTRTADFERFIAQWTSSHREERQFGDYTMGQYEMSSRAPRASVFELPAETYQMLETVEEPDTSMTQD